MASYADTLRGGGGGLRGRISHSSSRPVHESPLNHIPALNENAIFIDLRSVKADFSMEERNDFLLKDLKCKASEVKGIFPDPSTLLLRVSFKSADLFECYSARLAAGVPWAACASALVYGWAPGDSVTAVRVSAVPDCFPVEAIRDHFQQFGRVTSAVRGHDRFFKSAFNGIVHLSLTITPGFTLPHFVEVVDANGAIATRLFVHTDDHRRRCARCGHTGHVGQFCRAGSRAVGADAALWSFLTIPMEFLPPADTEEESAETERVTPSPLAAAKPTDAQLLMPVADWSAHVEEEAAKVVDSPPSSAESTGGVVAVVAAIAAEKAAEAKRAAAPAAGAATSTGDPSSSFSSSLAPLQLQLSETASSASSLPLGQGGQPLTVSSGASVPLSPPSPFSSLSSVTSASQRSARSRSPRHNRSASVNSRDSEADDMAGPAKGRSHRKRGLSGGKGGPAKAVKPRSPSGGATPPSQLIEQCASP